MGRRWWGVAGALALALAATACDEEEGCLDYRALRVDFYAEKACEDCCVYPALNLVQVPGRIDGGVRQDIERGTPIVDAAGDTAFLTALQYYVHDVALEFADGTVLPLRDTFGFRQNESAELVLQDRSLLRARPLQAATISTGELLREGEVVAVQLKFGLPEDVALADPFVQGRGSPILLSGVDTLLAARRLDSVRRLRSGYVAVSRGDGSRDSSFVEGAAALPYRLPLPEPTALRRSYNLNVVLLLPVAPLVSLPTGPVAAETFAEAFFRDAAVIETSQIR